VSLKPRVRLEPGNAVYTGKFLAILASLAIPAARAQTPAPPVEGSKEPIISQPEDPTPATGINGSIEAPPAPTTPVASTAGGAATRFVIFVVRKCDWSEAQPKVPSARPMGLLGKFTDTWNYDGSTNRRHSYHFDVAGNQEGNSFYLVVQTTRTGETPTYQKVLVTIKRGNG